MERHEYEDEDQNVRSQTPYPKRESESFTDQRGVVVWGIKTVGTKMIDESNDEDRHSDMER